jgi:hypothetical protein
MKRSSRTRKTSADLSEPIHRQLNMYVVAAGAAGVGVLALTQSAEAKIIYTPIHHVIHPNSSYKLDLNHDGRTDFTLLNSTSWSDIQFNDLGLKSSSGDNGAIGCSTSGGWRFDSALKTGARIGGGARFLSRREGWLLVSSGFKGNTTSPFGPWYNVRNRYLGLRFSIEGKTHYGWARLSVTRANRTITALLTGYAYETVPNKAIIAGKTKDTDAVSVQPGSLGRLAQGWPQLACWQH